MLNAFIRDESGTAAVAATYGAFALGLTAAIVSMAGMAGSVLDHSYSAIPFDATDRAPAIEGFSQIAGVRPSAACWAAIRAVRAGKGRRFRPDPRSSFLPIHSSISLKT
jgi:Flp pilus assembly pilin Flp